MSTTMLQPALREIVFSCAWRIMVRRMLVGYLRLPIPSGRPFDRAFFRERLDSALLHGTRRSGLRVAMGLDEGGSGP
jgi:hypothetical protein